jgi:hypothetical protein
MKRYTNQGMVFVGCPSASAKAGPEAQSAPKAFVAPAPAPAPGNPQTVSSAAAAIADAPADSSVVITGQMLESKTNFLFIKAVKITVAEALAMADTTNLPTFLPAKKAPSPKQWNKQQMRPIRKRSSAGPVSATETTGQIVQNQEFVIKHLDYNDMPMKAEVNGDGAGRRLLQFGDNRWRGEHQCARNVSVSVPAGGWLQSPLSYMYIYMPHIHMTYICYYIYVSICVCVTWSLYLVSAVYLLPRLVRTAYAASGMNSLAMYACNWQMMYVCDDDTTAVCAWQLQINRWIAWHACIYRVTLLLAARASFDRCVPVAGQIDSVTFIRI